MSTLARFRKSGGILQLIQLIECSEPEKQKHLLDLVGKEDPGWAYLIQLKKLSLERIFTWPDEVLTRILCSYPPAFAVNLHYVLPGENAEKLRRCLPSDQRKEFESLRGEARPGSQEAWVAQVKFIQLTRELCNSGEIRLSFFDPVLEIDSRLAA